MRLKFKVFHFIVLKLKPLKANSNNEALVSGSPQGTLQGVSNTVVSNLGQLGTYKMVLGKKCYIELRFREQLIA